MGICNYCNQNAGWFKYAHVSCVQKAHEANQQRVKEEQQRQIAVAGQQILDRNSDVVNKFLEIAERKVSVLDDYGDERMHLLWKELAECIRRLANREGNPAPKGLSSFDRLHMTYEPWRWINSTLRQLFTEYHELQKNKVRTLREINSLSGTEFETYVARILQQNGWQVSATPATGDQGADRLPPEKTERLRFRSSGTPQM